jgi:hypothetical protein
MDPAACRCQTPPVRSPAGIDRAGPRSRMTVTHDVSAGGVFPVGTEIVATDGTPAGEILARLLPYARTDGDDEATRVANLALWRRAATRSWPRCDG